MLFDVLLSTTKINESFDVIVVITYELYLIVSKKVNDENFN